MDTHASELQHSEGDPESHTSRPSLVIKAEGPSFQFPATKHSHTLTTIGFTNIASCIEIQVEGEKSPVSEQLAQVAIHARHVQPAFSTSLNINQQTRQLFIQQPNRRFVRTPVLTGHHLRLFHFDRRDTPLLDFHEDPHTFVRLVLGLSSPNEGDIGLDTSIQWNIVNGRKTTGTITVRGDDGRDIVYPLLDVNPSFRRPTIRGRCTTCWRVFDPVTSEELLIKDSWKTDDKNSAHVCLQGALGIPGVVRMVSCQPDRGQTRDLRGFGDHLAPHFQNRLDTRIVMEYCGDPLTTFTSARQPLRALRDAIAGKFSFYFTITGHPHRCFLTGRRELLRRGTLHRDVSVHNILLGKPGAEPSGRGVLIDLDLAIRHIADGQNHRLDWRIVSTPIHSYLHGKVLTQHSGHFLVPIGNGSRQHRDI